MHAEIPFFEWLTLYFRAPWGTVESSTHPQPVPESLWRTCEFSTLYLENCANACWNNVFWVINPYFWAPWGTVESLTPPQPVPESRWRTCEFSTLYLENCANACWNNVFWVINPLFLSPMGYRRIVNPSTTCSRKSLTYLRSLNFVPWKLQMHWDRRRQTILFIDIDINYIYIYRLLIFV